MGRKKVSRRSSRSAQYPLDQLSFISLLLPGVILTTQILDLLIGKLICLPLLLIEEGGFATMTVVIVRDLSCLTKTALKSVVHKNKATSLFFELPIVKSVFGISRENTQILSYNTGKRITINAWRICGNKELATLKFVAVNSADKTPQLNEKVLPTSSNYLQ